MTRGSSSPKRTVKPRRAVNCRRVSLLGGYEFHVPGRSVAAHSSATGDGKREMRGRSSRCAGIGNMLATPASVGPPVPGFADVLVAASVNLAARDLTGRRSWTLRDHLGGYYNYLK